MEFLHDWQFWSVVVGLLAILIPVVIFVLQRNKKRLAYDVLTETALLSIDDEIKGKIKIKYGRKNIQNIHLVILKVQNNGNVDIASSDYEQPIVFSFLESEILSAEIVQVSPKNLKPAISMEMSKLTINPILLNKGDFIVIKLLFSNYAKQIDVDTRIMGVKEIEKEDRRDRNRLAFRMTVDIAMIAWVLMAVIFIVFMAPDAPQETKLVRGWVFTISGLLIAVALFWVLASEKIKKRKE